MLIVLCERTSLFRQECTYEISIQEYYDMLYFFSKA